MSLTSTLDAARSSPQRAATSRGPCLRAPWRELRRRHAWSALAAQLAHLDDHLLRDIGLQPDMVPGRRRTSELDWLMLELAR